MASMVFDFLQPLPQEMLGGVVTIGNFDGVHRGHATLVAQAKALARERNTGAIALTFAPHPREILVGGKPQPLLTTWEERDRLLKQMGIDAVVTLRTTKELLSLSARAFFDQVIRKQLQTVALVEGENFCFGFKREGTITTLEEFCRASDLALTVVPPYRLDGQDVSSSAVRNAIEQGEVSRVRPFLGRWYRLEGVVGTGQRRGRTIGFPTANLDQVATLVPGDGVYAVRAWLGDKSWPGACNIGPNPTFGEQTRKIEVHLIGFEGNLYGLTMKVDFVARLRDTRKFTDINELTHQLREDVDQTMKTFLTLD